MIHCGSAAPQDESQMAHSAVLKFYHLLKHMVTLELANI